MSELEPKQIETIPDVFGFAVVAHNHFRIQPYFRGHANFD